MQTGVTNSSISVLLADDHEVARAGLRAILEAADDIEVIGEAKDGDQAKKMVGKLKPDVLLLEGLMVLHIPDIREQLDLRLFVELDADTRALRRLVRNIGHQHDPIPDHSPQSIANYYLESAKVGHMRYIEPSVIYADLIVRGDADFGRVAPMVAAVIDEWRNGT